MIDEEGARQRVEAELTRWREAPGYPDVVIDTVTEHQRAWIVTYGIPESLKTGDQQDQSVGATPFVVDKRSGRTRTYGSGSAQYAIFRGWLDTAEPHEARALFEDDARGLVGRRISGVHYWDIHDSGQGPMLWDHRTWHHSVMGVGLDTDRGPAAITWTNRFHPYGVEVFDESIERHLRLDAEGPQRIGPDGPSQWTPILGQVCRAVKVTWWTLELGLARLSDGTVVEPARTIGVPVAVRLEFDAGSIWLVAAIPGPRGLSGAFVGGDEIIVVFHVSHARALGIE